MPRGKKIYFASDFHLGVPDYPATRLREAHIVSWLNFIKDDAAEIYLVGDIFDFWFEYATVVPKGFIRLQGKLAELSDAGVKITFFKGNHDMWMFDYFKNELGADVISDSLIIERDAKKIYLHHGDGLGPGEGKYKILKKFFRSNICQWLFARLHPNLGISIAQRWSKKSRIANNKKEEFKGESEYLVSYCKEVLKYEHYDYMIFGHRHLPLDISLKPNCRYINLGEWINYFSYAEFENGNLELKYFIKNT
ncbi:MAG TPA: UDP-2,3-diacylglucosamine diphosphatase [Sphingobacteriaceae bacterium]|nr:UDP-2,3-diacylglucosamine diphosphatase [Sphingobacteriaceae bacterium]